MKYLKWSGSYKDSLNWTQIKNARISLINDHGDDKCYQNAAIVMLNREENEKKCN